MTYPLRILLLLLFFGCQTQQKPEKVKLHLSSPSTSVSERSKKKEDSILLKKQVAFDEFYKSFQRVIAKKELNSLSTFVDFPFNENISRENFSAKFNLSEDEIELILNSKPEKISRGYNINSDAYDVNFIEDKNGNWKLKSFWWGE